MKSAAEFWKRVEKSDGCWLWKGYFMGRGYGQVNWNSKRVGAHRVSYEITYGPVPDGMFVCHNCPDGDNPACVNPAHLWLGTHAENMADMRAKKRSATGDLNGSRTHPERYPLGSKRGSAKLTEEAIARIRTRYAAGGITQQALGQQYGVVQTLIGKIVRGEIWTHVP